MPIITAGARINMRSLHYENDRSQLLDIEQKSFANAWDADKLEQFLRRAGAGGLVASKGGKIVGYVLYERTPKYLYIAHGAVDPRFRSLGIGQAGLRLLKEVAEELPLRLHVRCSNLRARRLYEAVGFSKISTIPGHYKNGEDALVMQRLPEVRPWTAMRFVATAVAITTQRLFRSVTSP